jgi:hypothetical protein
VAVCGWLACQGAPSNDREDQHQKPVRSGFFGQARVSLERFREGLHSGFGGLGNCSSFVSKPTTYTLIRHFLRIRGFLRSVPETLINPIFV